MAETKSSFLKDFFGGFGFGDLLSSILSGIGSYFNYQSQKETNEANAENVRETNQSNKDINQANLDYNWQVTQEQWNRDDTAYQRAVADAQKAGFSPLVASGVPAGGVTSGMSAPSPIAQQAFQAKAPTLNTSDIVESLLGASKLQEERRHNQAMETFRGDELKNESVRLENQAEQLRNQAKSLDIQQQKVDNLVATLAETISYHDRALSQSLAVENEKLKQNRLEYQSKLFAERMDELVGKGVPRIYVDTEYKARLHNQRASNAFESLMKDYVASGGSRYAESESESKSSSKGNNNRSGFNVFATGFDKGKGKYLSKSEAFSLYQSNDLSEGWKQRFADYFRDYPVAIYVPRHNYKEFRESGGFSYTNVRGN